MKGAGAPPLPGAGLNRPGHMLASKRWFRSPTGRPIGSRLNWTSRAGGLPSPAARAFAAYQGTIKMLSYWMAYLQYQLGAQPDASGKLDAYSSWSAQLLGSVHWWMLLEATHILTLAVFAGSLLFLDLRLLGLVFSNTPFSRVNRSLLPITVGGFVVIIATGLLLFFSKPFDYYHNIAFRLKVVFLILAGINVFFFQLRVKANEAAWDKSPRAPAAERRLALLSLLVWVAVIATGRCMAYARYSCPNPSAVIVTLDDCNGRDATLAKIGKEVSL